MTVYLAEKVVIITEKMLAKGICKIIEKCGATGYTLTPAGGKGSRNVRATADSASVVDDFANIKVEVIVNDRAMAENLMEAVADKYFGDYPGITYLEDIKILRPEKFGLPQN